jgi:Protein of unknown function (DUF3465)
MSRNPLGNILGQVLRGATQRRRRAPTNYGQPPRRRAYAPRKPWWWAIVVGVVGIIGALVSQMGKTGSTGSTSSQPPASETREQKAPPADSTKKTPAKTSSQSDRKNTPEETDNDTRAQSSSKAGSRWAADRALIGNDKIADLFDQRQGKVWVVGKGKVTKNLYIDTEAPRHQKFLVKLDGQDLTVRIAHNIDIGKQAPIDEGDTIEFKGEYVYTEMGGTIHWTHHDPDGRPGGYLTVDGRKFD